MVKTTLNIHFDNKDAVFTAGETISGKVVCEVGKTLDASEIFIEARGYATVHLRTTKLLKTDKEMTEEYFNYRIKLWEQESQTLSEGRHELPFSICTPEEIPSSFEGASGYIRYICKCKIVDSGHSIVRCKQIFSIITPVDLNGIQQALEPARKEAKKDSFGCCKSGTIEVTLSIPHIGYISGQAIPVTAIVENNSRTTLEFSKAILKQTVVYNTPHATRTSHKRVAELCRGRILPNCRENWDSVKLLIPKGATTFLKYCSLINITYELKFIVGISDLDMKLPIILGTIPVKHPLIESTSAQEVISLQPREDPDFDSFF